MTAYRVERHDPVSWDDFPPKEDPVIYETLIKDGKPGSVCFRCPKCGELGSKPLQNLTGEDDDRRLSQWDPVSVSLFPSIVCHSCEAHYWITNGQVVHV